MKQISAFLMDFGSEHFLAEQLAQILSGSVDPSFAITRARGDDGNIASANGSLTAKMDGDTPVLLFFTFEQIPSDRIVSSLLESSRRFGKVRVSIVVAQAESPRELAHLFDLGAADVWLAPLRGTEVLGRIAHWVNPVAPSELDRAVQPVKASAGLGHFIGESPALLIEIKKIPVIACCRANVLIRGETGTGKEICARAIHYLSARRDKPFVPLNCGALPLELLENELFGHAAGAFTSANAASGGIIEQADGGTLFLDEIDSLPLAAQVKLLRFVQDQQYRSLGSRKVRTADLRILAATNVDMDQLVRSGAFRQDLLYRLNVLELTLPPLRTRGGDTELLARHFLNRYCTEFGKVAKAFTEQAMRKLRSYPWPGNIRQLEHVIERAVALSALPIIGAEDIDLPQKQPSCEAATFKALKARVIQTFELQYLSDILTSHQGNISRAARAAGMDRGAFWRLLRKNGLSAPPSTRSRS